MGRGILRGADGDENLKFNFIWPYCKDQREMPLALFYDIPCYVTKDYEMWYTSLILLQYEEIHAFEVQNHVSREVEILNVFAYIYNSYMHTYPFLYSICWDFHNL